MSGFAALRLDDDGSGSEGGSDSDGGSDVGGRTGGAGGGGAPGGAGGGGGGSGDRRGQAEGGDEGPWGAAADERPKDADSAAAAVGRAAAAFATAARRGDGDGIPPWCGAGTPAAAVHAGLVNTGNTCFLNAVLQALLALPPLRALVEALRATYAPSVLVQKAGAPMLAALLDFVADLPLAAGSGDNKVVGQSRRHRNRGGTGAGGWSNGPVQTMRPRAFDESLRRFRDGHGSTQQDAQELLTFVLDSLHIELAAMQVKARQREGAGARSGDGQEGEQQPASGGSNAGADEWEEVGTKGRSLGSTRHVGGDMGNDADAAVAATAITSAIAALMQGEVLSTVRADSARASTTVQPFTLLTLDIPDADVAGSYIGGSVATVESLLAAMCYSDEVEYTPEGCSHPTLARKTLSLRSLPPVLVLHLNRFAFGAVGASKRARPVRLAAQLRPPPGTLAGGRAGVRACGTYTLTAVVCHMGASLNNGHYVADVRTQTGGWLRCDDSLVDDISQRRVLEGDADTAYLLFYTRQ